MERLSCAGSVLLVSSVMRYYQAACLRGRTGCIGGQHCIGEDTLPGQAHMPGHVRRQTNTCNRSTPVTTQNSRHCVIFNCSTNSGQSGGTLGQNRLSRLPRVHVMREAAAIAELWMHEAARLQAIEANRVPIGSHACLVSWQFSVTMRVFSNSLHPYFSN
jgi:hypothetical protein